MVSQNYSVSHTLQVWNNLRVRKKMTEFNFLGKLTFQTNTGTIVNFIRAGLM